MSEYRIVPARKDKMPNCGGTTVTGTLKNNAWAIVDRGNRIVISSYSKKYLKRALKVL